MEYILKNDAFSRFLIEKVKVEVLLLYFKAKRLPREAKTAAIAKKILKKIFKGGTNELHLHYPIIYRLS